MRSLLLCLSIVASSPAFLQNGPNSTAPTTAAATASAKTSVVPSLERIAVIGASVSDGFGLDLDVGARTVLADVVEATLKTGHDPVQSPASSYLFTDPLKSGREEIEAAKAKNPTLVVGIDFLFWFGYGRVSAEADRAPRFEKGLELLEGFKCPALVGDMPDMSQALDGKSTMTGRPMLRKNQVPTAETLKQLNERLAAWAAQHTNIVILPLASLVARMHAGEEIALRGTSLPKDASKALFQPDLLHPTLQGAVTVWLFALDCLVRAQPTIPADAFDWDAKSIAKKVYDAKEPERKAKLEKQKKAEERAKKTTPAGDKPVQEPTPH